MNLTYSQLPSQLPQPLREIKRNVYHMSSTSKSTMKAFFFVLTETKNSFSRFNLKEEKKEQGELDSQQKQLRSIQFLSSSSFSFRYFSIRFIQIAIKINHFCVFSFFHLLMNLIILSGRFSLLSLYLFTVLQRFKALGIIYI